MIGLGCVGQGRSEVRCARWALCDDFVGDETTEIGGGLDEM